MSYAAAAHLQAALHACLTAAPALAGVPVLDAQPAGTMSGTWVLLGAEEVADASDQSGKGAEHRVVVSVLSDAQGFLAAKDIAAAISTALDDTPLILPEGRVVSVFFRKAVARRLEGATLRRIDLTYRIRVEL